MCPSQHEPAAAFYRNGFFNVAKLIETRKYIETGSASLADDKPINKRIRRLEKSLEANEV